jgi:hypothetical protein
MAFGNVRSLHSRSINSARLASVSSAIERFIVQVVVEGPVPQQEDHSILIEAHVHGTFVDFPLTPCNACELLIQNMPHVTHPPRPPNRAVGMQNKPKSSTRC